MNTVSLIMAQYGGKAVTPIEDVCRDYFRHMNPTQLARWWPRQTCWMEMVRRSYSAATAA